MTNRAVNVSCRRNQCVSHIHVVEAADIADNKRIGVDVKNLIDVIGQEIYRNKSVIGFFGYSFEHGRIAEKVGRYADRVYLCTAEVNNRPELFEIRFGQ